MLTPLPPGLSLEDQDSSFRIIRKWFSFTYIFTFFFSVFWNAFLVMWYTIFFNNFSGNGDDVSYSLNLIPLIFPLIHVAIGISLFYYSLAGFLNKTVIEVKIGELSVKHTPLPWKGNLRLLTADIRQLYCQEKITRTRNGSTTNYTVLVILQDNRSIPLVKGLTEKDQASYIEQLIESKLGIRNEQVAGEMSQ